MFDPPRTLGPATAMVPDVTAIDPISTSIAPQPSPNAQQPARVTDSPGAPYSSTSQGRAAKPAARTSEDPSIQINGAVVSGSSKPPPANNIQSPNVGASKPSQNSPSDPPQVPKGDPAAGSLGNSQQQGNSQTNDQSPVNKPAAFPPIATPPAANQGPSNPDDESAAQMSALHQALDPAPLASSQAQPAPNQPAANQPDSPPIQAGISPVLVSFDSHAEESELSSQPDASDSQDTTPQSSDPKAEGGAQLLQPASSGPPTAASDSPNSPLVNGIQFPDPVGSDEDPRGQASSDPVPQGGGVAPAANQPGPQQNSAPTTIYIGSKANGYQDTPGSEANKNGESVPAENPDGAPGSVKAAANHYPVVTVAGSVLTISDPSAIPIAGTVLTPGGAEATIAGIPVSLAPSGNLVIGSSATQNLADLSPPSVFNVGGQSFIANPTGFEIAGTTLSVGGSGVTISGAPISLDHLGSLVIGMSTVALGNAASTPEILTTDGQIFTVEGDGQVAVGGATLTNGGPATTISGVSLRISSNGLIIGSNTIPIPPLIPTASIITTDGQIVTVEGAGNFVAIDGATLKIGGSATTISGIPMKVYSDGLVVGTTTSPAPAFNGSASTTPNPLSSNPTSAAGNSAGSPHTAGTGKPKAAAASCKARVSSVRCWGLLSIVVAVLHLG